jgi:Ca2+-binding RTX toxin-like protein
LIVDYSTNTYATGGISSSLQSVVGSAGFNGYFKSFYTSSTTDTTSFSNIERFNITGTAVNDNIKTGSGNDTISAGAGNDTIDSGVGIDSIDGGAGIDTLLKADFSVTNNDLTIDDVGTAIILPNIINISNIEYFLDFKTGSGNDSINFTARSANTINTGSGDDTINAGLGYDVIDGGSGNDLLIVDYSTNTYATGGISSSLQSVVGSAGFNGYFQSFYTSSTTDTTSFSNIERFNITGTAVNDNIKTGSGNDTISAGAGNDTIDSGVGIDSIDGGAGIDTLLKADFSVTNNDLTIDDVGTAIILPNIINISNIEYFLDFKTGSGNDSINFTARSANTINTGSGDDTINAGLGYDVIDGGSGNDLLIVDYSTNIYGAGGISTSNFQSVVSSVGFNGYFQSFSTSSTADTTSFSNIERFNITGTAVNDNIKTGSGNDTITAGAGNDTIDGGSGANNLNGGAGNDKYIVSNSSGGTVINDSSGVDTIQLSASINASSLNKSGTSLLIDLDGDRQFSAVNDLTILNFFSTSGSAGDGFIENIQNLVGTAIIDQFANDSITGSSNNDNFYGGIGNDTIDGGPGNDYLIGGTGTDSLIGGEGDDILDGAGDTTSADKFAGGTGNDVYGVYSASTTVVEINSEGIDTVWTIVDNYTLSPNVENLYLVGNLTGNGNSSNNIIVGYGADDHVINGLGGDDYLIGGTGKDTIDGGDDADYLNGGAGIDDLRGGAGNDVLDGAGDNSADTFTGGTGDDVYGVYNSATKIVENADEGNDTVWTAVDYNLSDHVENLYLVGNLTGNGNNGNNIIVGYSVGVHAANSYTINGLGGNDYLIGGAAKDTIDAGDGDDYLNGGAGIDDLKGGAGNDVLDGSGDNSADTFAGGNGDDSYGIYNSATKIVENAGEGNDTVWTAVDYNLSDYVENLYLVGNLTGNGNNGNNIIVGYSVGAHAANSYIINGLGGNDYLIGGAAKDTIDGGDGDDYLNGGLGIDDLKGGAGNDVLDGSGDNSADTFAGGTGDDVYGVYNSATKIIENAGEGNDTVWTAVDYSLTANIENLYLVGSINGNGNDESNLIVGYGIGNNTIHGLDGNDTIDGGAGDDNLFGEVGNDTFILNKSNNGIDIINDFEVGSDLLQLSKTDFAGIMDVNGVLAAGVFTTGTSATSIDQRLIYDNTSGDLFFDVDGSGSTAQVQIARLSTKPSLTSNSFSIV